MYRAKRALHMGRWITDEQVMRCGCHLRSLRCWRAYHVQPAQAVTPNSSAPLSSSGSDTAGSASCASDCSCSCGGPRLSERVVSWMMPALLAAALSFPSSTGSAASRSCCSWRRRGSRSCRLRGCCCSCWWISRCLSALLLVSPPPLVVFLLPLILQLQQVGHTREMQLLGSQRGGGRGRWSGRGQLGRGSGGGRRGEGSGGDGG